MGVARLLIQVLDDDLVVHEFRRSTSQPTGSGVHKMLGQALGWMQAYQGAVNDEQWIMDVNKAKRAQKS